jgi:hypothetical protein
LKSGTKFSVFSSAALCGLAPLREAFVVTENEVAKQVVDAAYKIHTTLGPGLLESV